MGEFPTTEEPSRPVKVHYLSDSTRTPSNRICPSFDTELRTILTAVRYKYDERERTGLTPIGSVFGPPRSSQTNIWPEDIARRSSVSSLRVIIGKSPSDTAWNMTCASAGERTRTPVQVGRCMSGRGQAGRSTATNGCRVYIVIGQRDDGQP
jgi:hypothetical protein